MSAPFEGIAGFLGVLAAWKLFTTYRVSVRNNISISELYIYPIKSCHGIKVSSAKLIRTGLEFDRIFMVVNEKGKFLTQRKYGKMAQVKQRIIEAEQLLELNAPGMPTITVPLRANSVSTNQEIIKVIVWDDECDAVEVDSQVNAWFSEFLEAPGLRLVRMTESFIRQTEIKYAPLGQASFSDGFPMLLASQEGLDELNRRLPTPVTIARFRPNIVVSGCSIPFEEDTWSSIQFQTADQHQKVVDMAVVKPCARCPIPNLDPETGLSDGSNQPTATLKTFRTGKDLSLPEETWKREVR